MTGAAATRIYNHPMIDLLISPCSQLLTLEGGGPGPRRGAAMRELGLVEQGALAIDTALGTVVYAGPASELPREQLSSDCQVLDAAGCVVMPGFVDSHTHLVFAGSRADEFYRRAQGESYQSIAQSGGGIAKTMSATRESSEAELAASAWGRLRQLYSNGTTAVEIKSGYGLSREDELASLRAVRELRREAPGLVFATFLGAHLIPPEYKDRREQYVTLICEMLPEVDQSGLADFYDIFVDPLAFGREEAARIVAAARATRLRLRLHADEFGDDGTAAWGVAQGALSLDHLGGIGPEGIAALAGSNAVATLLPATMFFSGHGRYAPAREMIEAGCAVALATDLNPGSSLVYSMPFVMTLAALEMKLSAEECIVAATLNAAHALGAAGRVGSLARGKRADALVLDVPHYAEIACHVGRDIARDVVIGGSIVKRDGCLEL